MGGRERVKGWVVEKEVGNEGARDKKKEREREYSLVSLLIKALSSISSVTGLHQHLHNNRCS